MADQHRQLGHCHIVIAVGNIFLSRHLGGQFADASGSSPNQGDGAQLEPAGLERIVRVQSATNV